MRLSDIAKYLNTSIEEVVGYYKENRNIDLPLDEDHIMSYDLVIKSIPFISKKEYAGYNDTGLEHQKSEENNERTDNSSAGQKQEKDTITCRSKLGKVKFYDSTKGWGYINNFDDNDDCFFHVSKMLVQTLEDDEIVSFETVESKRKPGEFNAINITNRIPVFVSNSRSEGESSAIPLLKNHLDQKIKLDSELDSLFYFANAKYQLSKWKISSAEHIIDLTKRHCDYGQEILKYLFQDFENNMDTIISLIELLYPKLPEEESNKLVNHAVQLIESSSISEVNKGIDKILDSFYLFKYIIERSEALNKISFVLWANEKIDSLPDPDGDSELNYWNEEILPQLDWVGLQQVILKLSNEKAKPDLTESTYKFLLKTGWTIESDEDYDSIHSFLKITSKVFQNIRITENSFRTTNIHFLFDLYKIGLISELSDETIITHVGNIEKDDEKVELILQLPKDKIIPCFSSFPSLNTSNLDYS